MKRLSKVQSEILDLMNSGWELGKLSTTNLNAIYFLQKGGIGMGGESKDVNRKAVRVLLKLCLIEISHEKIPCVYYRIKYARTIPI